MRIITKFKDYYDSARCFTFCEGSEAVYIRKTETQKIDLPRNALYWYQAYSAIRKKSFPTLKFALIGFCGKIYTVYTYQIDMYDKQYYPYDLVNPHNLYFYNKRTLLKELLCNNEFKAQRKGFVKVAKRYPKSLAIGEETLIKSLKELDAVIANFTPELEKWFLKYKIPVFVLQQEDNCRISDWELILNPKLEDYKFYKQFVPTIAYQELEMFFNSVLVTKENPIQITDSLVLLQAKGFDKKISFRHRK